MGSPVNLDPAQTTLTLLLSRTRNPAVMQHVITGNILIKAQAALRAVLANRGGYALPI